MGSFQARVYVFAGKMLTLTEKGFVVTTHVDEPVTVPSSKNSVWQLIKSVERMRSLSHDWDGHGSEPPNDLSIELARRVLFSIKDLTVSRTASSAQGGIGICFLRDHKYADIECLNTGEIVGTTSRGDGRPDVWAIHPTKISAAIDKIGEFINS
jgi:hypothetical protein